jgi:predicted LPLAT superfamily acyltransferase
VSDSAAAREWTTRPERGALPLIRAMAWLALHLGRPAARLLLFPISLYYLLFSGAARRASRDYLERVLPRRPGLADVWRHFHCFATCVLDRVFLLTGQTQLFDLRVTGEAMVLDILRRRTGCILLGAHFGSFEAARALGRRHADLRISLVMYEENARKIKSVLTAIDPELARDVIALGASDSMIRVGERLERGDVVGILADRSIAAEATQRFPFLGSPAAFPQGAFRMAALMRCPVVLMMAAYRGGRRYDVVFETLIDAAPPPPGGRAAQVEEAMRRYVERLEHYCRAAPFNWFNFYDFWA